MYKKTIPGGNSISCVDKIKIKVIIIDKKRFFNIIFIVIVINPIST